MITEQEVLMMVSYESQRQIRLWMETMDDTDRREAVKIAEEEALGIIVGAVSDSTIGNDPATFVKEICEIHPCAKCRVRVLYETYRMWVEVRASRMGLEGKDILSSRGFRRVLEGIGFKMANAKGEHSMDGLDLKDRKLRRMLVFARDARVYGDMGPRGSRKYKHMVQKERGGIILEGPM